MTVARRSMHVRRGARGGARVPATWTPASISHVFAFWDASQQIVLGTSPDINSWTDLKNGLVASKGVDNNKPHFVASGPGDSLPSVRFHIDHTVDGTDLQVPDNSIFDPNNNMRSFAFWLRREAASTRIMSKQGSYGIYHAGSFIAFFASGTESAWNVGALTSWRHILITYDGTQAVGSRVLIYDNNVLASKLSDNLSSTIPDSSSPFWMGDSESNQPWKGWLDQIVLASGVFTSDERARIFAYKARSG